MEYEKYLREVDQAADATDGKVVSLAGGYFGVQLPADWSMLSVTRQKEFADERGQVRFGYWATLGPPGPDDRAM